MTCDECQQLLPLHALGGLDPAELEAVRAHLASGCPACAAALAQAEALLAKIPESLDPVAPSAAARDKLMAKVRDAEPDYASLPLKKPVAPADSGNNWLWAFGGAIAAGLIVGVTLWVVNAKQRDIYLETLRMQNNKIKAIEEANAISAQVTRSQLAAYQTVLTAIQAKDSKLFDLAGSDQQPGNARARIVFDPGERKYYLLTTGLKQLPEGKVYELWLIDEKDTAGPVPAGTFTVREGGVAIINAAPDREIKPTVFAITDETAPGGKAPAGQIQLSGKAQPI